MKELSIFFESKSATSLILAGAPGTGKTTLALQILETYKDKYNGIYLSTRVGDSALYQQFPWIKDMENKTKIIDAGRLFLDSLKIIEANSDEEQVEAARLLIKNIYDDKPAKVSRVLYNKYFKDLKIPELKRVYNEVERNLPNRSMIIIDSVEGLSSKYKINEEELIYTLVKDLVDDSNANIIFILEKKRSEQLEYIADGVFVLDQDMYEGRKVRSLNIIKMRGVSFKFSKYMITLNGGKFRIFSPTAEISLQGLENIEKDYNMQNKNLITTGSKDLDTMLDGGFKYGTLNLISVSKDVSKLQYETFMTQILGNILSNNIGILAVPSLGQTIEGNRNRFKSYRFLDPELVDNNLRFIDYSGYNNNKKYVISLTGRRESSIEQLNSKINELRKYNKTIVYLLSLSTIEKFRGQIAFLEIVDFINNIINSNDIGIAIAKPGIISENLIKNMASIHIRLLNIYNKLCLYGIAPKTILYAIEPSKNYSFDLVPIV
ncbi:MAG: gas vesicle protein GvpD P-loop domain-containing protein [Thermoplasmata archaeon]